MNIPELEESLKDCEPSSLNTDNIKFSVWVSFFEIYNECIYDLFAPVSSKFQKRKMLRLSQDVKGYSFIKGKLMNCLVVWDICRKASRDMKICIFLINIKRIREVCCGKWFDVFSKQI